MKKIAIILAGGNSRRAGGDVPKQMRVVAGKPIVWWSMHAFVTSDPSTEIIVVLNKNLKELWNNMWDNIPDDDYIPHLMCDGGICRTQSVKSGLELVPDDEEYLVAVHDAARPLVDIDLIKRCWRCAEDNGSAIPVVNVTDSIRKVFCGQSSIVDRNDLRAVQTPQVFLNSMIQKAYSEFGDYDFSDDASLIEAAGFTITLIDGNVNNIKVTYPIDFCIADVYLNK